MKASPKYSIARRDVSNGRLVFRVFFVSISRGVPKQGDPLFLRESLQGFVTRGFLAEEFGRGVGWGFLAERVQSGEELSVGGVFKARVLKFA